MSIEANKALVRRYQEAYNTNNLAALDDILSPAIATSEMLPGFPSGVSGIKHLHRLTLEAWPDFHTEIEDLVAEGDQVTARVTITGTAVNPGFGLPGTGKSFRISGIYLVRIADGKIVEHSGWEDAMGIARQIGAMPGG